MARRLGFGLVLAALLAAVLAGVGVAYSPDDHSSRTSSLEAQLRQYVETVGQTLFRSPAPGVTPRPFAPRLPGPVVCFVALATGPCSLRPCVVYVQGGLGGPGPTNVAPSVATSCVSRPTSVERVSLP